MLTTNIPTLSSSNSNPQLKKLSELNIQLSVSESSSLYSASSSSSSTSSTSTSCCSSEKQVNQKVKNSSTNTCNEIENPSNPDNEAENKPPSNQSQFISFLKNPLNAFTLTTNGASSNAYPAKNVTNMKSHPSIPTLLKPKQLSNIQSSSYGSLSSTSAVTNSSKLNYNEANHHQRNSSASRQHHQSDNNTKSPLKFVQPKKPNQLLTNKYSPIRKSAIENSPSDSTSPYFTMDKVSKFIYKPSHGVM